MKFATLSALAIAVMGAQAKPIRQDNTLITKSVGGRDVSLNQAELDDLEFFSEFAGAAYCNSDEDDTGNPVACTDEVCPTVRADKPTIVATLDAQTFTNMQGFVAVDPVRKVVVVSYRGTHSIRNWITNLSFLFVDCDLVDDCSVHEGFHAAWEEGHETVLAAVKSALEANPGYSLVVTGHSLGGAVATISGAQLRAAGFPNDIYTYGSPRVGNDAFANFVTQQAGAEYRVTHLDDPVPRLPPLFIGYRHTSPEYWLSTGTATTDDYALGDIKVCPGIANLDCNGDNFGLDIDAHVHYFGHISACSGDGTPFRRDDTASDEDLAAKVNAWQEKDIAYAKGM